MQEPRRHSETHSYELFAADYAGIGVSGTYVLAFRDLPALMDEFQIERGDALDHGCGAGRSSRMLNALGFKVTGVDRTPAMLAQAKEADPTGDYRLIAADTLSGIPDSCVDLVFQSSVLEEYASEESIQATFSEFHRVLRSKGHAVIVTVSPDTPKGDWVSLCYPDRAIDLKSGDTVRCLVRNTAVEFRDYYWTDRDLRTIFEASGFEVLTLHRPLGRADEGIEWLDELRVSPWSIYVLKSLATGD